MSASGGRAFRDTVFHAPRPLISGANSTAGRTSRDATRKRAVLPAAGTTAGQVTVVDTATLGTSTPRRFLRLTVSY